MNDRKSKVQMRNMTRAPTNRSSVLSLSLNGRLVLHMQSLHINFNFSAAARAVGRLRAPDAKFQLNSRTEP